MTTELATGCRWNGTDEFIDLARELGFEARITTNYISGTDQEAADWVEYANGSATTPMGRLRAQSGRSQPYGIKYRAVGNEAPTLCSEQYTGSTKLSDYAARFRQYQAAMRKVDPLIRVLAACCGFAAASRLLGLLWHRQPVPACRGLARNDHCRARGIALGRLMWLM